MTSDLPSFESFESYKERTNNRPHRVQEKEVKIIQKKMCNQCGVIYPIEEFSLDPVTARPMAICPSCEMKQVNQKQPAIIIGKSKSPGLLQGLSKFEEEDETIKSKSKVESEVNIDMVKTKECVICGERKPLKSFVPIAGKPGGFKDICRACDVEVQKNREAKINERKGNKTCCSKCGESDPKNFYKDQGNMCKNCIIERKYKLDKTRALDLWPKIEAVLTKNKKMSTKSLAKFLKKSTANTSTYSNILTKEGLLNCNKKGRTNYYSLPLKECKSIKMSESAIEKLEGNGLIKSNPKNSPEVKPDLPNSKVVKPKLKINEAEEYEQNKQEAYKRELAVKQRVMDEGIVNSMQEGKVILDPENEDEVKPGDLAVDAMRRAWDLARSKVDVDKLAGEIAEENRKPVKYLVIDDPIKTPEYRIKELLPTLYPHSEKITIEPATNEIHIKLKEVD